MQSFKVQGDRKIKSTALIALMLRQGAATPAGRPRVIGTGRPHAWTKWQGSGDPTEGDRKGPHPAPHHPRPYYDLPITHIFEPSKAMARA